MNDIGFYIFDSSPANPLAFIPFPSLQSPDTVVDLPISDAKHLTNLKSAITCASHSRIMIHIDDIGRDIADRLINCKGRYL